MADLDPQARRMIAQLARQVTRLERSVKAQARKPQLGSSSVEGGSLRAGPEDNSHVLVADDGVHVFVPSRDGTGLSEAITLGGAGGNAWQSTDGQGNVLGSMSTEGDLQGATLGVSGVAQFSGGVWLQGEPAGGQSPGDGSCGPTIGSRDLISQTAQAIISDHPGDVEGDLPWMEGVAFGQIARGARSVPDWTYSGSGGQLHVREIMSVSWTAVAGRAYLLQVAWPGWYSTDAGTGAFGASMLKVNTSASGRVGIDTNGRIMEGGQLYAASGAFVTPTTTVEVRCPDDVPEGQATALIYNYVYAGRQASHVSAGPSSRAFLAVYDMGRRDWGNDAVDRDGQQQGSAPAPPAPDPPAKTQKTYTATKQYSQMRTFRGSGSTAPSVYSGDAAQGYCPAAPQNGTLKSMITFPSFVGDLAGADVLKVEVYLHFAHWWNNSGGTAVIGTHGALSLWPDWGDVPNKQVDLRRASFDNPDGHWITMPAANNSGWKSGYERGIILTAPSTAAAYYGICTGATVRITYRK